MYIFWSPHLSRMGFGVCQYTTEEGFVVPELYITIDSIRMVRTFQGEDYSCFVTSSAWKSKEDRDSGVKAISIPKWLSSTEILVRSNDCFDQTILGIAYDALKVRWQQQGFTTQDRYESMNPKTFIYDSSGFTRHGYNAEGYSREGYDKDGYNKDGYDREGYNKQGFDSSGYTREGYDSNGCNKDHLDKEGNPCPSTQ